MLAIIVSVLAALGLITVWAWRLAPSLPDAIEREIVQRNLITSFTVLAATAVVLTLRSPWAEMDDAAGSTVRRLRLAVFLVTAASLAIVMAMVAELWESPDAGVLLVRAFGGWLGVTLIGRQILGESLGWLVSFAWAGLSLISGDSWRVHYPPWAWSMQGADNRLASALAITLFLVGVGILVRTPIRLRAS